MGTPYYIRGWKGLAQYTSFSISTLRNWHYRKARAPFIRIGERHARIIIAPDAVHKWLEIVSQTTLPKEAYSFPIASASPKEA